MRLTEAGLRSIKAAVEMETYGADMYGVEQLVDEVLRLRALIEAAYPSGVRALACEAEAIFRERK